MLRYDTILLDNLWCCVEVFGEQGQEWYTTDTSDATCESMFATYAQAFKRTQVMNRRWEKQCKMQIAS